MTCVCVCVYVRVRKQVCVYAQINSCMCPDAFMHFCERERETFHVCVRVCLSIVVCVYLFKHYCSTYEQNGGPGVDARLQISINPKGLFYCSDVAIFYCFKATFLAKVVLQ